MNTVTDLATITSSVFGLFSLVFGFRLLRRKPLVIPSWLLWAIPLIIVSPLLVATVPGLVSISSPTVLWALLPLLMIAAVILFMTRNFGHVTVFNVTEDAVYDSLFDSLHRHGIEYSETRARIHLTRSGAFIRVTVQDTTKTAFLRFSNTRAIPRYREVMTDFKTGLQTKGLAQFPINGVLYIAMAVMFLGAGLAQFVR